MEISQRYFVTPEEFDCRVIENYSESAIDAACDASNQHIIYQQQSLTEISRKCRSVLAWLLTAISGLVGYVSVSMVSGHELLTHPILILALLALTVLIAAALFLWLTTGHRRSSYGPGSGPSLFFHKDIREWVEECYDSDDHSKMIKGCYLQDLQHRIIYNGEEIRHRVRCFRIASYIICAGVCSLFLLNIILAFS